MDEELEPIPGYPNRGLGVYVVQQTNPHSCATHSATEVTTFDSPPPAESRSTHGSGGIPNESGIAGAATDPVGGVVDEISQTG
jgi:hypothetical protein